MTEWEYKKLKRELQPKLVVAITSGGGRYRVTGYGDNFVRVGIHGIRYITNVEQLVICQTLAEAQKVIDKQI